MAKKDIGIVKPKLTRFCAKCGKMFTARHVVDDETLCEQCRKERNDRLCMERRSDARH